MAVREGAWDCPFCEHLRNRGPDRFCGACGSPRGADVKFYLPDDARVVEDQAELERARSGPDWTCGFCEGDNPSRNAFCVGCGAGKDGSPPREVVEHLDKVEKPPPPPPAKKSGKGPLMAGAGCLAGCGVLLVFLFLLGLWLSATHDETLSVSSIRWTRSIEIQRQVTERKQDWRDMVPAGAREVSSRREVRSQRKVQVGSETRTRTVSRKVQTGTEKVKVGTRDMGNGYFEDVFEERPVYKDVQEEETYQEPVYKEEPVYDQKVTYDLDTWKAVRQAEASGNDTRPRWPDARLASGEREGPRKETYEVTLQGDGKTYTHEPATEAEFARFEPGSRWKAKIDRLGKVQELEPGG